MQLLWKGVRLMPHSQYSLTSLDLTQSLSFQTIQISLFYVSDLKQSNLRILTLKHT